VTLEAKECRALLSKFLGDSFKAYYSIDMDKFMLFLNNKNGQEFSVTFQEECLTLQSPHCNFEKTIPIQDETDIFLSTLIVNRFLPIFNRDITTFTIAPVRGTKKHLTANHGVLVLRDVTSGVKKIFEVSEKQTLTVTTDYDYCQIGDTWYHVETKRAFSQMLKTQGKKCIRIS